MRFTLYDIKMQAAAEPQPLQDFRDDDPGMILYQAIFVLFYTSPDFWTHQLMQRVAEVGYEAEKLSLVECSTLGSN